MGFLSSQGQSPVARRASKAGAREALFASVSSSLPEPDIYHLLWHVKEGSEEPGFHVLGVRSGIPRVPGLEPDRGLAPEHGESAEFLN